MIKVIMQIFQSVMLPKSLVIYSLVILKNVLMYEFVVKPSTPVIQEHHKVLQKISVEPIALGHVNELLIHFLQNVLSKILLVLVIVDNSESLLLVVRPVEDEAKPGP
jgi:hypothetical protein